MTTFKDGIKTFMKAFLLRLNFCLKMFQMSDIVTALKLTGDPMGSNPGHSTTFDADSSALDVEQGMDLMIFATKICK